MAGVAGVAHTVQALLHCKYPGGRAEGAAEGRSIGAEGQSVAWLALQVWTPSQFFIALILATW